MFPKLFDSHSHIQFEAFKDDTRDVIKEAHENNVWMLVPGTQSDTSKSAVLLAQQYKEGVYAAVGLHPLHLLALEYDQEEIHFHARAEVFDYNAYKQLAKSAKVVAIGECGLEYFRIIENAKKLNQDIDSIKALQQDTFSQHVKLASELNLPVIIHCRASQPGQHDAYEDALKILKEFPGVRGVLHCFTSDMEIAKAFLELGFFISFTGIITFAKDSQLLHAIRSIPLEQILIETDSPYLAPVPFRGKRNHPMYVTYVASRVAHLKDIPISSVASQTTENALKLFRVENIA